MQIKTILNQNRRDFTAIYQCGHCQAEQKGRGYDDDYFHQNVIPAMVCKACGKSGEPNYTPLETKYQPWEVV